MACRRTIIATPLRQIDMPKDGDFWVWYRETLAKADMIDLSLVAEGHFVLRVCPVIHSPSFSFSPFQAYHNLPD